jgi:hypothetical protein
MLGLPAHPGHVGALLLAIGIVVAAVLAPLVWRHTLAAVGGALGVAALISLLAVSTAAAAPFVAWRIVEDVHYTSRYTSPQAERIGGDMAGIDWHLYTWLRSRIPRHDTFYVDLPPLPLHDQIANRYWSGYVLLPRIRVDDPREADWVLGWGKRPDARGVRLGRVSRLDLPDGKPPVYFLARVQR